MQLQRPGSALGPLEEHTHYSVWAWMDIGDLICGDSACRYIPLVLDSVPTALGLDRLGHVQLRVLLSASFTVVLTAECATQTSKLSTALKFHTNT